MLDFLNDFLFGDVVRKNDYMYDTPHLITLALVAILTISLIVIFKNKPKKQKNVVLWVFWSILLFFEISSRVVNLIKGKDFITTMLPFHFCSIMVWFILITIPLKNKHLYNIAGMGGLIATTAFMVHPAVGFNVEVLKFSQYYSVISHSLGFCLSIFILTMGYTEFRLKNIWSATVFVVLVYIHSFLCNYIFYPGSNYMYYRENIFSGVLSKWFIPLYVLIVVSYFLSFFIIGELKHRKTLNTKSKKIQ